MESGLLQLAQDLEWLGRDVRRPASSAIAALASDGGGRLDGFLTEKQRGVIATADKIARELLTTVRFDPTRLVGVGCPVEETLDSVGDLIAALEEIKQEAVAAPERLPAHIRAFNRRVEEYLDGSLPSAA